MFRPIQCLSDPYIQTIVEMWRSTHVITKPLVLVQNLPPPPQQIVLQFSFKMFQMKKNDTQLVEIILLVIFSFFFNLV